MSTPLQSEIARVGMKIKYLPRSEDDIFVVVALPSATNPNFSLIYSGHTYANAFNHSVSSFNRDFKCLTPMGDAAIPKNIEVFAHQFQTFGMLDEFHSMLIDLEI